MITFEETIAVIGAANKKFQERVEEVEAIKGAPLRPDEINSLSNCLICGDSIHECTHGE